MPGRVLGEHGLAGPCVRISLIYSLIIISGSDCFDLTVNLRRLKGSYVKVYHYGPGPTCATTMLVFLGQEQGGPITHEILFLLNDGTCYASEGLVEERSQDYVQSLERKSDYEGGMEAHGLCFKDWITYVC